MANVLLIFGLCLCAIVPGNTDDAMDGDPIIDALLEELKGNKECKAIKMPEMKQTIMMVPVTLYNGTLYNIHLSTREGHCKITEKNGKMTIKAGFGNTKMYAKTKIKIGGVMDLKDTMVNVKIGKGVIDVVLSYDPNVDKIPKLTSLKLTKLEKVKMTLEGGSKLLTMNPVVTAALKFYTSAFKGEVQKLCQNVITPVFKIMLTKANLPI